jgi:hypothetical protein
MLVSGVRRDAGADLRGGEAMEEGMIFHESPFGDWLSALIDPPTYTEEFAWEERGEYYRTDNLIRRRKSQEQRRLDRWSNVRRAKRARELDRRRNRKEGKGS